MDCDCIAICPFFNDRMSEMPTMAEMMKRHYCKGDFSSCARHMVKEKCGKERVPSDLIPNQRDRAQQILALQ